jgi:hypothetical protein
MRYYRLACSKEQAETDVQDMIGAGLTQVATMNLGRYSLTFGKGEVKSPYPVFARIA